MTLLNQTEDNYSQEIINEKLIKKLDNMPILCNHCKRTATNGIKCKGICVSDSDY